MNCQYKNYEDFLKQHAKDSIENTLIYLKYIRNLKNGSVSLRGNGAFLKLMGIYRKNSKNSKKFYRDARDLTRFDSK